ncbi:UvrD-helicase domain-containing protein [Breznakiella homolactica]|uniref:DNA 3'-5' helicase n=1 Tax=Breznakiella homolactica TaxID=2798577 RepID=A0A7T7XQ70_9SPIR|nr:UvrD-helicase domain-containing protein [Breznakiella homolactica]QQO10467.1 UvrD-helicase domain-containing protein [Breznakiella homolactica]
MRTIADLHIHSRFSRATSSKLTPAYLDRWARIKGLSLLGTGDCTHPVWLRELRDQLEDAGDGLFALKHTVRSGFDAGEAMAGELPDPGQPGDNPPLFVLTGEISTIYKKGDKTRKVHHVVLLPGFEAAATFQRKLEQLGNIASDGRPILGLDSRDLLEVLLDSDERSILIPAHIWTPWFSALGAKSGFDSIDECYGDLAPHITAIETGLSSNPPMNWALESLDRFSIISNSDAHSPDKLAREATVFEMERSYASLAAALRIGNDPGNPGIIETIEFFPQEGKYHYDGHRKCSVYLTPEEAADSMGICPVCGKALTRGVMGRVMELADRPVDEEAPCPPDSAGTNKSPYRSLIPLKEILSEILKTGTGSKKVDAAYSGLIRKTGNELSVLMDMAPEEIEKLDCPGVSGELLAAAVRRMRSGEVSITPGYDGEYGIIRAFGPGEQQNEKSEAGLFGELPELPVQKKPKPRYTAKNQTAELSAAESPPANDRPFALDADQEKAVTHRGNHSIIIAGPGTGKTAVLANRITRLLSEGADPSSILGITFTVKAAAELRERIAKTAGPGKSRKLPTATFHSFCVSVLREQASKIGLAESFGILAEDERHKILAELCAAGTGEKKKAAPKSLGKYIEERKRYILMPGKTEPNYGSCGWLKEIALEMGMPGQNPDMEDLYSLYRERLRSLGVLDFDDLITGTVRLFMVRPEILSEYRNRFRYIFVDEYQDVNFAQYALIRLLVPAGPEERGEQLPELCVIGDPNQAIYGFRGSDKRFIDRFLCDYPGAASFRLSKSFRCAAPIIDAAGRLMDTRLSGQGTAVNLFRTGYPTEKSEAEGIARHIARLIGGTTFFSFDTGVVDSGDAASSSSPEAALSDLGECAVLVRAAALAAPIVEALKSYGVPFQFAGEKPWWEEGAAKTLLDAVRLALSGGNPGEAAPHGDGLSREIRTFFLEKTPEEALGLSWDRLRRAGGPGKNEREVPASVEELIRLASLYGDYRTFMDSFSVVQPEEGSGRRRDGIQVMTIHASKGLEFDHVFVAGAEEGILPFTLFGDGGGSSADPENYIDEERRLLYVAMTRARIGLYLSWANSRQYQGRKLRNGPSRFFADLESIIPLSDGIPIRKKDSQLDLF